MTSICLHCFISGRVQGVFYRRETQKRALALGLRGYVKNLSDSRVEALLCGEREAVLALQDWLWQGPPAAEVTGVESKELPYQNFNEFEMR
jgi:acylphosphatase